MGSLRIHSFVKLATPAQKSSYKASCFFLRPQFSTITSSSFRQINSFAATNASPDNKIKSLLASSPRLTTDQLLGGSPLTNISLRLFSCGNKTNMKVSNANNGSEGVGLNKPATGVGNNEGTSSPSPNAALSKREQLKIAIRDYGATVLVFHVTMSLASLGICYVLVSSGLDVVGILEKVGIGESIAQSKVTAEAGKFVVAYAVHKVFAPVRITITLTATPLIVRKLRSMGILKQSKKQALKTTSEK